jgi:hypothetical protein
MGRAVLHRRGCMLLCLFVGCTVYAPAAKTIPEGQAATLSFSRGSPQIEIRSAVLDGASVLASLDSVQVAPGRHSVVVVYDITVADFCDGLQETCPTTIIQGACDGDFEVAPRQERVISLDIASGAVRAVVRPPRKFSDLFADSPQPSAQLACRNGSSVEGATRGAL